MIPTETIISAMKKYGPHARIPLPSLAGLVFAPNAAPEFPECRDAGPAYKLAMDRLQELEEAYGRLKDTCYATTKSLEGCILSLTSENLALRDRLKHLEEGQE